MKNLNEAVKNDSGKVELHVLPFLALEEVGFAMADGIKKYGEYNWALVTELLGVAILMRAYVTYGSFGEVMIWMRKVKSII